MTARPASNSDAGRCSSISWRRCAATEDETRRACASADVIRASAASIACAAAACCARSRSTSLWALAAT